MIVSIKIILIIQDTFCFCYIHFVYFRVREKYHFDSLWNIL